MKLTQSNQPAAEEVKWNNGFIPIPSIRFRCFAHFAFYDFRGAGRGAKGHAIRSGS